jgi:hypothetical protein
MFSRQLNLKKLVAFPAPHMVQKVLKLEDIPKLLPNRIKKSIINAIKNPEIYQGHG